MRERSTFVIDHAGDRARREARARAVWTELLARAEPARA
jgi:hypothetical protein